MAKKLRDLAEEDIDRLHNGGPLGDDDMKDKVCQLHNDLLPLEDKIKEAQAAATVLFRTFKAETGLSRQDFAYHRKIAMLQDDGEREKRIAAAGLVLSALDEFTEWLNENDTDT
jgi:hypothetical protein